ncbi:serine-rich adhesin for platelets-like [Littorina saxatilis]|uniref:Uncharacterized protein n=1 Tax=Littorina saxatilis TaxID=31220 RepID=A0AAN9AJ45_9CAEN
MDPFDPFFTVADDGTTNINSSSHSIINTTTTTDATAQQDFLDIFGGSDVSSSSPQQSSEFGVSGEISASDIFDQEKQDFLCDFTDNTNQESAKGLTGSDSKSPCDVLGSFIQNRSDTSDAEFREFRDMTEVDRNSTVDVTQESADLTDKLSQKSTDLTARLDQNSDILNDELNIESIPFADEEDEDLLHTGSEKLSEGSEDTKVPRIVVEEDSGGGISCGVIHDSEPFDAVSHVSSLTSTKPAQPLSIHPSPPHNEPLLGQGDTTAVQGEITHTGSGEVIDELQAIMDAQGETHGGMDSSSLDDFFSSPSSAPVTNGIADVSTDSSLRLDDFVGVGDLSDNLDDSRSRFLKECSPDIVVDCADGVENVTLKDATSEKALLGSAGEDNGTSLRTDSLGSRTDEDKRKSSSDIDMDFAVLELDSSHLNLDMNKQKTSLRKRGSLARRKKPTRNSIVNIVPGTENGIFQDSTDSKPVTSPTSDTAEDDVFDRQRVASEPQPEPEPASDGTAVRKSALPFKPPMIMPGLQDLSKSKLFNQERHKSDDSPTSPIRSPLQATSPLSPTKGSAPPLVLPKPTTKGQKDTQNKTIAAENFFQDFAFKPSTTTSSGDIVSASVTEAVVIPGLDLTDSGSFADGPKPARTDSGSGSLSGLGPKLGRTDSWSSVSGPRKLSRGESVSSVEGGEGGSRRSSIQGSAYAPIGFKPRRSSSIVMDTSIKLVESPAPPSPSPSPATPSVEEEGAQSTPSSGVRSPLYKAPVWLSEMKAKTGNAPGESSVRLRTASSGSTEGSAASFSSSRSRNGSESAGSVDGSAAEGARGRSISDDLNQKRREEQEPEKPSWMKAAAEKTSRTADKLQTSKGDQENGEEDDDKNPTPPWAGELKKMKRPVVGGESNNKVSVTPFKNGSANDKENTPVANAVQDQYMPSWAKSGRQLKKTPLPPPGAPARAAATNGKEANPMKAYETPKWKLDLAEKKKRREAEMLSAAEGSTGVSTSSSVTSGDGSASGSASSDVPQWRQQLSQRKKRPTSGVGKDGESETGSNGGGAGPDWARQAEERRKRIIKSGLVKRDPTAEASTNS